MHSPRGWLAPSGSGAYKVSAALSEAQALVQEVLDTAVPSGLQLLPLWLLTKCSGLHAEGGSCPKTWATYSCRVRWESPGSEHSLSTEGGWAAACSEDICGMDIGPWLRSVFRVSGCTVPASVWIGCAGETGRRLWGERVDEEEGTQRGWAV